MEYLRTPQQKTCNCKLVTFRDYLCHKSAAQDYENKLSFHIFVIPKYLKNIFYLKCAMKYKAK
jgi:hypothetical protein